LLYAIDIHYKSQTAKEYWFRRQLV
jgi:hypothetical protein